MRIFEDDNYLQKELKKPNTATKNDLGRVLLDIAMEKIIFPRKGTNSR